MKLGKLPLNRRAAGGVLFGLLLVVSFQNCSQNGFETELSEEDLASSSGSISNANANKYGREIANKIAGIPVAYKVGFDQITYNSCFSTTGTNLSQRPGAFSFKFGAHYATGLGLSSEAVSYINDSNNFRPIYPATSLSVGQKKSYIYDSPNNRDLTLQLAWRPVGLPGALRNTKPVKDKDYKDVTMNLSDDRALDPLLKSEGSWIRYFPFASDVKKRRLEASFFYNDDEALADFLRRDLQFGAGTDGTKGMLAFAFRKASEDPRKPFMPNGENSALGLGYSFSFRQQDNGGINHPANIMNGVEEIDLKTGSLTNSVWTCPQQLVFRIIRREDAATFCPAESYSAALNSAYRANLAVIRNHLPASDWDVNLALGCAVPKGFSCYPNEMINGALVPVDYASNGAECFQSHKQGNTATNLCAQHISICLRSQ